MPKLLLSPDVYRDFNSILFWSHENFGEQARERYEALLFQAIRDVAENPERSGIVRRIEISPVARTYHLCHSRNRAKSSAGVVKQPRHFLLFRVRTDGYVEIARILHDSMEIERHLPDEYRPRRAGDAPESA